MSRFELLNDAEEVLFENADKFEMYPNEKIRLRLLTGDERESLKNSIILNGILEPVLVMPSSNRGKLLTLSGHNRIDIAKELSLKVPYRMKTDLTQEQADLICIDSNLCKRQLSSLLPSELAYMFKVRSEAMKHQGKSDDTLRKNFVKFLEDSKFSRRSIQLYIRLTYLTDELLKMVDEDKLNFVVAVSLSFLRPSEMQSLYDYITNNNYKITPKIAEELKKLSQSNESDIDIKSILNELNKPEEKIIKPIKLTVKELNSIIPKEDLNRSKEIVLLALKQYYNIT
jgi:ParB family chromosome partitioning protein